jgi:hypothetical protein
MMQLTRILVFPLFLSASWINSPNRDAFQNAQRIPWETSFDHTVPARSRLVQGLGCVHLSLSVNVTTNTYSLWIRFGSMGRESQAFAVVSSAMLASNDVLDMLRTAPSFEGSGIRSDDRYVHGRFAGAARPSVGMTFSH